MNDLEPAYDLNKHPLRRGYTSKHPSTPLLGSSMDFDNKLA